jgi:hypothetical protein
MASLLLLLTMAASCGERCAAVLPVLGPDRVDLAREVLVELVCCPQRIRIATLAARHRQRTGTVAPCQQQCRWPFSSSWQHVAAKSTARTGWPRSGGGDREGR